LHISLYLSSNMAFSLIHSLASGNNCSTSIADI
jgi:hypothetical protein